MRTARAINESGVPCDFRVECQDDPDLLYIDAASNRVGAGLGGQSQSLMWLEASVQFEFNQSAGPYG